MILKNECKVEVWSTDEEDMLPGCGWMLRENVFIYNINVLYIIY